MGLVALGIATLMTPVAGRIAGMIGLVAYPKRDRWHRSPTPLLGGVAMFVGIVPLFLLVPELVSANTLDRFGLLMLGATLMFLLGLLDDLWSLPPYAKLLGQIVAACVLVVGLPI